MANNRRARARPARARLNDTQEIASVPKEPQEDAPNPPRTTTHGWTSPKFGSAGSGGAELSRGRERLNYSTSSG